VFSAPVRPLDVVDLLDRTREWLATLPLPGSLVDAIAAANAEPPAEGVFTIGSYGKVGAAKGSFDLVAALSTLASRGVDFSFLTVGSGRPEMLDRYWRAILDAPALAARTWVLPPLAPWRIPTFLRRCDAVCGLERGFPIAFHGPLVAREILACGACLVCSREVADKPAHAGGLVDDRNAMVVADPRDRSALADRLGAAVADPDRTRAIAHQGQLLSRFWEEDLPTIGDTAATFAAGFEQLVR
jgi:glycosyltransferase involved in cell wall biosynthesis